MELSRAEVRMRLSLLWVDPTAHSLDQLQFNNYYNNYNAFTVGHIMRDELRAAPEYLQQ